MARSNDIDSKVPRHRPAESMNPSKDNDSRPWFASDDDAPDGGLSRDKDKRYSKPGPVAGNPVSRR